MLFQAAGGEKECPGSTVAAIIFNDKAQSSNLFPIPHFPSLFQRTTSPNLWDSTLSQVSQ
jgi:hypothetical protein